MKTTISNTISTVVGDIVAYLGFLREQGYYLSLCRLDPLFASCMNDFLPYGGHAFEHCMRVKACRKQECDRRQEELKRRVTREQFGPFECFAGVTEYVFPIECEQQIYGIVCLSGYRTKERKENRAYMQLNPDLPDGKRARAITTPLLHMLEILLKALKEAEAESFYTSSDRMYYKALQFISDNLEKQFTLNELCETIGYSQTYVSREFKKRQGKSVFDYVIDLRLQTAKKLLIYTDLSVTAIAVQVGFSGPNYFTSVFKERMGCTPRDIRKHSKEKV